MLFHMFLVVSLTLEPLEFIIKIGKKNQKMAERLWFNCVSAREHYSTTYYSVYIIVKRWGRKSYIGYTKVHGVAGKVCVLPFSALVFPVCKNTPILYNLAVNKISSKLKNHSRDLQKF